MSGGFAMPTYTVMVDDNFHYMDEDERRQLGTFATFDKAVAACRLLVDQWLADNHKPGMTTAELYSAYVSFGEDPFIVGGEEGRERISFSAWDYAKARAEALCAGS
jgi:hypothetical protein